MWHIALHSLQAMARPHFQCSENSPYHVTSRCINKEWFTCETREVWDIFCTHLLATHHFYKIEIHAFVLMSNHFHLLARAPEANLSEAMCFLLREVSRDVRHNADRINQVFAERFKRTLIEDEAYYINTLRYVYQNPVRAKIVQRVEDYPFSSLRWILGWDAMRVPTSDGRIISAPDMKLGWLNSPVHSYDSNAIRVALKKPKFAISGERQKHVSF